MVLASFGGCRVTCKLVTKSDSFGVGSPGLPKKIMFTFMSPTKIEDSCDHDVSLGYIHIQVQPFKSIKIDDFTVRKAILRSFTFP